MGDLDVVAAMNAATDSDISASPKVVLHDHLDGGLRPATVIDLAREAGHRLPSNDPAELADWFHRGADRQSLDLYLETFVHTVGVMRTPEALERVTYEAALDLAADGVVYAELRIAPELVTTDSLDLDGAIAAIGAGARRAERDAPIVVRTIVCSMRHADLSEEAAAAAMRGVDAGVVGFDLAGPEAGYPASRHAAALASVRGTLGITLHAGEAAGGASILDAVDLGATRLGHGVRLIDDPGGSLADRVRNEGIVLEVCPTSNVNTRACGIATFADHPVDRLRRAGLPITISCDNRLMSAVTPNVEWHRLRDAFAWDLDTFDVITDTAVEAAFCDDDTRRAVRATVRAARDARPS